MENGAGMCGYKCAHFSLHTEKHCFTALFQETSYNNRFEIKHVADGGEIREGGNYSRTSPRNAPKKRSPLVAKMEKKTLVEGIAWQWLCTFLEGMSNFAWRRVFPTRPLTYALDFNFPSPHAVSQLHVTAK